MLLYFYHIYLVTIRNGVMFYGLRFLGVQEGLFLFILPFVLISRPHAAPDVLIFVPVYCRKRSYGCGPGCLLCAQEGEGRHQTHKSGKMPDQHGWAPGIEPASIYLNCIALNILDISMSMKVKWVVKFISCWHFRIVFLYWFSQCWVICSIVISSYRQPMRSQIHNIITLIYLIIYLVS